MFSKFWGYTLFFAILTIFFSFKIQEVWTESPRETIPASGTSVADGLVHIGKAPSEQPEADYNIVRDRNLFSPNRREVIPESEDSDNQVEELNKPGLTISLFGVVIMEEYKRALVTNPLRGPEESPNKWVKEGDRVGDLLIASIEKERLLVEEDGKRFEVALYDSKRRRGDRASTRELTPKVVVAGTEKEKRKGDVKTDSQASEEEYEIIKTPFGDIKRKKR